MVYSFLIFATLTMSCKVPPPRMSDTTQPVIRIGIVEQRPMIEFKVAGKFNFSARSGRVVLRDAPEGRWRIEPVEARPAQLEFRLAVGTTKEKTEADDIVRFMAGKGLAAEIRRYETGQRFPQSYMHNSVYQVLLVEKFETEAAARQFKGRVQEKTNSEIIQLVKGEATGSLRFTNLDNRYALESREPLQISAPIVEVAAVDVGTGFHWERSEHRKYTGTLEFLLDDSAKLTVVNEIPLETYLRGVVPSEMPVSFPLEALKAQAVAARVEALAKIGVRHPVEPFDLCDDVHCQAFSGVMKQNEKTDRAVAETRGLVMLARGKLSEAFYAGMCGGHTENNDNVWIMNARSYLRGLPDASGGRIRTDLRDEKNVRQWIDSTPRVYCNTTEGEVPASVSYSKKYFRWQVSYARTELEQIIRNKTGESFGQLVDLLPVKRGVSGRIIELEIVGTSKRFKISKELVIRQTLSSNTLYSACFYVQKQGGTANLADTFVLKGGGWGHGVGMCQVGAAMMAEQHKSFGQILKHYYQGVMLTKVYR